MPTIRFTPEQLAAAYRRRAFAPLSRPTQGPFAAPRKTGTAGRLQPKAKAPATASRLSRLLSAPSPVPLGRLLPRQPIAVPLLPAATPPVQAVTPAPVAEPVSARPRVPTLLAG